MDASRVISLRFREACDFFCWTFHVPWHTCLLLLDISCFLAYFFLRLASLNFSPSHIVLRHSSYCYCLWSHIVDHWLHVESPFRSHVSGPVLALQPIFRFSLASTLFGRTCPQEPLAVGLRSSFGASGSIPLDHSFLAFSWHYCPYGPTTLTPVLAL